MGDSLITIIAIFLAAILMFCLYLFFWKGENWTHPALFLVGFVATYLAMRSRVSEMAIMRSLGTGSRRVFLIFFLEQTALAIIGTILGLTVSMIYYKGIQIQELGMIGLFLVFFLSGSIISIIQMNKKNVLKILSTAE